MISRETIRANLKNCLIDTDFLALPNPRRGKVRDTFDLDDRLILVTTDRQSAFDRVLTAVPFKGQVLNQVSAFWFDATADIVKNQVIDTPDPNVTVAKKCRVLPIEFVVRAYLTGSTDTAAWTNYAKGARMFCGNRLPDGMVKNQKFEQPILTPTTKAEDHDESIAAADIMARGIIEPGLWRQCEEVAFGLFARGTELARQHGLILVDTKYEMGLDENGELTLIDEIHTPDSSRFWLADSYEEHFSQNLEPENIDKEFLRLWFKDNCDPYNDPQLPPAPEDLVVELSSRYIRLFEMITGSAFAVDTSRPVRERLTENLRAYLQ